MSNSLLEHLSAINDLVEDVLAENAALKKQLSRSAPANKPKLSKREVDHIRKLKRDSGLSHRAIADIYDIHHVTVGRILKGQYHK